jgi:predicted nucleic acid-binding protein
VRILVDTSAWIDFLNGHPSLEALAVSTSLGSSAEICCCGLVVSEVMQGLRNDRGIVRVVELFDELTFLEPDGIDTYKRAAEFYRLLRQRGQTVRSTVDCLIAVIAEEQGCTILARDRDLETIVGSGLLRTTLAPLGEVHEGT